MQNLALQSLLAKEGENLHGSGERVAAAGGQQAEGARAALQERGQESTEDTFGTACADVEEVEVVGAIVGVVVTAERVVDVETV
jgi:hypothetical protein